MAATATARKPTAHARRTAPKRAGAPKRRAQLTPIPGRLVPLAVGRTAIAVGGLADSGLVLRLTRGRLWIGALAALLVGIVALNVMALSLNASSSKSAGAGDGLKRQNSALRAQLAEELSNERVQRAASSLGLIVPEPGLIRYLEPDAGDAAEAAKRLRAGELSSAPTYVAPVTDSTAVAPAATDPAAAEAPAETTTEAVAPPAQEVGATPAGGGVASP